MDIMMRDLLVFSLSRNELNDYVNKKKEGKGIYFL